MLQDIFIEQTVKKEDKPILRTLYFVCVGLTGSNVLAGILIFPGMFVPALLFGGLAYYIFSNMDVEFDYAYTNGVLEVAKVRAQQKRKSLCEISAEDIIVMAKTGTDPVVPYRGGGRKAYDCTSHKNTDYYVLVFKKSGREAKLLFEPNSEILDSLKRKNGSKIYK